MTHYRKVIRGMTLERRHCESGWNFLVYGSENLHFFRGSWTHLRGAKTCTVTNREPSQDSWYQEEDRMQRCRQHEPDYFGSECEPWIHPARRQKRIGIQKLPAPYGSIQTKSAGKIQKSSRQAQCTLRLWCDPGQWEDFHRRTSSEPSKPETVVVKRWQRVPRNVVRHVRDSSPKVSWFGLGWHRKVFIDGNVKINSEI